MEKDIKTKQSKIVKRSYLARDFDGFKYNLIQHAKTFFPNNIEDFTETGLGGMFVDMISYIGDSMSFYLDHQFNELSWADSVEVDNLKNHIRLAGVKASGASPSSVYVDFYIRVPYTAGVQTTYLTSALPIIKKGTRLRSSNGITFNLMEDLDFSRTIAGEYAFEQSALTPRDDVPNASGVTTKIVNLRGLCVSGEIREEAFSIADDFTPFREIILAEQNISLIESVKDSDGNIYYEVDNLAQDNVFTVFDNKNISTNSVEQVLSVTPAPYRYTRYFDPQLLTTTITFGSGDALANDDDLLPDPADLSVPLYGRKVFSRFALDPNSLLRTSTLGVAPRNTTVTITYRHGGGFSHNVGPRSINEITFLDITFSSAVTHSNAVDVRSSLSVLNPTFTASGGSPAASIDELRDQIPVARNSQSRIVTKEDLLARIYSLPAPFGRVFRAALAETPDANGQIEIALISRNSTGKLINFGSMSNRRRHLEIAGDNLKLNLKTYLDAFRLINDSYIIMDAAIHNFGLNINVISVPGVQKANVVQSILTNLKRLLDIRNFHINQPLAIGDINYAVMSSEGVSSIDSRPGHRGVTVLSLTSDAVATDGANEYSYELSEQFVTIEERGYIFPKKNGIFELKYPDIDIRVSVR